MADYDASTYKMVNDSTTASSRTKDAKVVQTITRILSADGKTLTFTGTGVNANAQQVNYVAVYDKQ